jgi:hypothetical protein
MNTLEELLGAANSQDYQENSTVTEALKSATTTPTITVRDGQFVDHTGRKLGQSLSAVILGGRPAGGVSRSYFENGFSSGQPVPPRCSSRNGITPDTTDPISTRCAECQKFVWGSGYNGVGRACREYKTLAVILAGEATPTPVYDLRVLGVSLRNLNDYVAEIAKHSVAVWKIETQIRLSPDYEAAVMQFAVSSLISPEDFPAIQELLNRIQ